MGVISLEINYYQIGQRVRKFRKVRGLSQEQLAEKINISVTHMSHIETGNTKLSLQVFADLAAALDVSADDLLGGSHTRQIAVSEIAELLDSCSAQQVLAIADISKAVKTAIDQHIDS